MYHNSKTLNHNNNWSQLYFKTLKAKTNDELKVSKELYVFK